MHRPLLILGCVLSLLAGCGGSEKASEPTPFDYETSAPLDVADRGVVNRGYPIKVHDVSFTSGGRRIDGFVAVPPGKGPFPAVLYLHGSGGNRAELITPAAWMAARGVVTMTISMPDTPLVGGESAKEQLVADREGVVAAVVAARRAVDVLRVRRDVKKDYIGLVGFSAGARMGAILAGVEPRIRAFDLISGGSPPVQDYADEAPAGLKEDVLRELGAVDPLKWVAKARVGAILLQDGRRDMVVPHASLVALARAAGKAAELRWYDQGHSPEPAAWRDQLAWLGDRLGVAGPVVAGAQTGP